MTSPRVARAHEIVAEIQEILEPLPEFAGVVVGIDGRQAEKAGKLGAVIVGLPKLEFTTFDVTSAEWDIHIIAGPPTNWIAAWDRIDSILEALREAGLALTSAEPGSYQPTSPNAAALPAYTATLND